LTGRPMNIPSYLWFFLSQFFKPQEIVTLCKQSIYQIDYALLHRHGTRLLIFDVDDTLSGNEDSLPEKSITLIKRLRKSGFTIALYSNCTRKRRRYLIEESRKLGLLLEASSSKPAPRGYIHIMDSAKISPGHTAMIGDRPGMDLWGALLAGIPARILVRPYSESASGSRPLLPVRILRSLESRAAGITK
jgi:predicted HAD superfamily phosphohydrolase YqeG